MLFEHAFIPIAVSSLAQGKMDQARDAYTQLERANALGGSIASLGRADFGRVFRPAEAGARERERGDRRGRGAEAHVRAGIVASEAHSALGQRRQAREQAESLDTEPPRGRVVSAAQALLQAGDEDEASKIVVTLAEARKNFGQFLNLRTDTDVPDPLAADARKRIDSH
jgi:hypothetical protein